MSYQVLARKWRPRNFSTLVGQEHVVRALTHALAEQRLHHAYLFTGTRGVGKTTIARILAKSLNCETGITATPCGQCTTCQEIDAGRFVDLLEVDAATNTKVDEMRQLLENAVYAPTRGRFKVYVIDEVHMLSNSAFNAMLKTLEEPPEHVKFILATTDPQKIPVTVLSRCLQFNLKQMPEAAISRHLAHILQAEAVSFETGALGLIARAAAGSMRDALSLLDQAIAHGAGRVEEAQVRSMLGVVGNDFVYAILEALVHGDAAELLRIAGDISLRSLSFASTLQELAAVLTRLQILKLVPSAQDELDPDAARLTSFVQRFSNEFLQLAYQIAVHGRQELPLAPDEYAGFTMTLLRLLAFRPEQVSDVLGQLPPKGRAHSGPAPATASAAARNMVPRAESGAMAVVAPREAAAHFPDDAPAVTAHQQTQHAAAAPAVAAVDGPPAGKMASESASTAGDALDWNDMVAALRLTGLPRELALQCALESLSETQCVLRLPPEQSHLQVAGVAKLQQALSEHLGRPLQVRIETGAVAQETPALVAQKAREARQKAAVEAIEQDPFVRDVVDLLDASIVDASIRPIA